MNGHDAATHVRRDSDRGIALVTVILVLALCSAMMVGFVTLVVADQRAAGQDRDQTKAYAAAHAGLEKLTAELSTLFTTDFSPTRAQIDALATTPPVFDGFDFVAPDGSTGYTVGPTRGYDAQNSPISDSNGTIAAGPYQGLRGIITPYAITVTAHGQGGAEVRLRRELQTVAVPVLQFGMFSETDLAFHAGEDFDFGGRVHTNGNLYLAQGNGSTLTLADRVTAVGEVIRTHLPNGLDGQGSYNGTVRLIRAPNVFRNLLRNEGSLLNTTGSSLNEPKWTSLSIGTYNGYIRNGRTGARQLRLPLVSDSDGDGAPDAQPVEIIRRPDPAHADPGLVFQQRYFAMASLRILLSDNAADITGLPTVTSDPPYALNATEGRYAPGGATPPFAASPGQAANGTLPANVYKSPAGTPTVNGYLKVELQRQNGQWMDVTAEILGLGIAGRNLSSGAWNVAGNGCAEPNPNAVIRLQRVRDVPVGFPGCGVNSGNLSQNAADYWPLALYDTREGQMKDGLAGTTLTHNGIMHYVELDVNNLRRWLAGQIGVSGTDARNDNGFIVYFSDRRNNCSDTATALCAPGQETGEYGYEDVVNPPTMTTANGSLDPGEDFNGNGVLDTYGGVPHNYAPAALAPYNGSATPWTTIPTGGTNPSPALVARANAPVFFRRALKLVNGGQNLVPAPGLTVASENPVYVQGSFNATTNLNPNEAHVATAVVADAVTMLSNNWNDIRSFVAPSDSTQRPATTTAYRVAIISGKGLAFPQPGWAASSFGSDGGAHNFIRNLENWNINGVVQRYRGSFVSLYISRQGQGTFKCCDADSYVRGDRSWSFDEDFLSPTLLPPGTPMFRDVNTLTFRQLLRPNQ